MAREDAQCLLRGEPRAVLTADEEDNDSTAAFHRRVEPPHLIRLRRARWNRSGGHSPEQRQSVAGAVASPARCRSTTRDQLDQELQILSPVTQDGGTLKPRPGDEDEARCGSV